MPVVEIVRCYLIVNQVTINTTRFASRKVHQRSHECKVQPHDVDSDKADSDVTFVETAMVVAISGSITPEPEY